MLTMAFLCALACTDSLAHVIAPTAPTNQDSNAVPAPLTVNGCAAYDISLAGTAGKVTPLSGASCGPLIPTIIGVPRLDVASSTLTLPVAIRNSGRLKLRTPLAVMAQSDSVVITGVATGAAVHFPTAGAQSGDSVAANGRQVRWSFDGALYTAQFDSLSRTTLRTGDATQVRSLSIVVPAGTRAVHLVLHSTGRLVFTAPLHAPRGTPRAKLHQIESASNLLEGDPTFGSKVVHNVVLVELKPSATAEDRQAAVDAIDGIVVGGVPLGVSGMYIIGFPTHGDNSGAPLQRAIETLRQLSYVKRAMAYYLHTVSPAYLRP